MIARAIPVLLAGFCFHAFASNFPAVIDFPIGDHGSFRGALEGGSYRVYWYGWAGEQRVLIPRYHGWGSADVSCSAGSPAFCGLQVDLVCESKTGPRTEAIALLADRSGLWFRAQEEGVPPRSELKSWDFMDRLLQPSLAVLHLEVSDKKIAASLNGKLSKSATLSSDCRVLSYALVFGLSARDAHESGTGGASVRIDRLSVSAGTESVER